MTPTNNIAEESHCFSCPDPPSCLPHPPLCNPATVTHMSLCGAEVVENKRVDGWMGGGNKNRQRGAKLLLKIYGPRHNPHVSMPPHAMATKHGNVKTM